MSGSWAVNWGLDLWPTIGIWLPALIGLLVVAIDLVAKRESRYLSTSVTQLGLLATAICVASQYSNPPPEGTFGGTLLTDRLTIVLQLVLLLTGMVVFAISGGYVERSRLRVAEYQALTLWSLSGMLMVVAARDLLLLFIGIELLSIPLYVLAAFLRRRLDSVESGFKYFLMGAFASGFLLYGIAILYGIAGSTLYGSIQATTGGGIFQLAGLGLILIGLSFKVAAVPFHMWAPDVYEGAPTPVTAFMATGVKVAGFAALLVLVLNVMTVQNQADFVKPLSTLAILTMIVGNLGALLQPNIKRMLAYSSIAHAGYLLVGLTAVAASTPRAASSSGVSAIVFYLVAYSLMTLGAFAVVLFLNAREQDYTNVDDFRGLARRHPVLAILMSVFMFALVGIPPTAGFFGKFYLFKAAVESDLLGLALVLAAASALSLWYYMRVVVAMYMKRADDMEPVPLVQSGTLAFLSVVFAGMILYLGALPATLMDVLSR
ncbi:MAG: NADH-quinone oxidoreductase subunit N [Planctomycetota bacterium]